MKRLLLLLALCLVVVVPASALIETFQDGVNDLTVINSAGASDSLITSGSFIEIRLTVPSYVGPKVSWVGNPTATSMTYSAATMNGYWSELGIGYLHPTINVYDSGMNLLYQFYDGVSAGTSTTPVRYEMVYAGGSAHIYKDGVEIATSVALGGTPSYVYYGTSTHAGPFVDGGGYTRWDDLIWSGTDHHVIETIPDLWIVSRDFLTPVNNGVYEWNPATLSYVLQNTTTFFAIANKEYLNPEILYVRNVATGTIIDTRTLTASTTIIPYDVPQFLANATTDGQYSICFDGSANCGYVLVTAAGAYALLDKTTYNMGDTAILTYDITPTYYDPAVYDYTYRVVNIYGVEKASGAISNTGTALITFSSSVYVAGVYYVEVVATKKSDSTTRVMAAATLTLHDYVVIAGTVLDAQTALPLSGANINITQALTTQSLTSGFDGNYTTTSTFLTGGSLNINATAAGYKQYLYTFTPLSSGTKTVTISLEPETPTYTGVAIGGVVRDDQYGNPIVGVTAYVMNGTTYQNVTNSAGWYQVDNLVSGTLYNVWSSGVGYRNSSVEQKLAVGV